VWVLADLDFRQGDAERSMSKLSQLSGAVLKNIKANSPIILSVAAGVGTIATAFLVGKASFEAANVIQRHEEQNAPAINPKQRFKDRTRLVWKFYIPSAISTTSTIVCIAGANRVGTKKTLAANALLAVTERAYSEYRDKVVEEFGPRKDQSVRDKVVAEQIANNPSPSQEILVTGPGNVLCCEMFTMRYFACDMERLRRAQNDLNSKLLKHDYATFDDFYYMIGLQQTSTSGNLGWTSDKLMELEFSTALSDDGRPCITFTYNYTKTL
jgi:Family of unknown function (DUF6353)